MEKGKVNTLAVWIRRRFPPVGYETPEIGDEIWRHIEQARADERERIRAALLARLRETAGGWVTHGETSVLSLVGTERIITEICGRATVEEAVDDSL